MFVDKLVGEHEFGVGDGAEGKADFIIAYSLAPAAVQIAKSMQKIGLKTPWTGTWGLIAPNFLKLGGKELIEGVMAVTSYTPDHSANAKALHEKVETVPVPAPVLTQTGALVFGRMLNEPPGQHPLDWFRRDQGK